MLHGITPQVYAQEKGYLLRDHNHVKRVTSAPSEAPDCPKCQVHRLSRMWEAQSLPEEVPRRLYLNHPFSLGKHTAPSAIYAR